MERKVIILRVMLISKIIIENEALNIFQELLFLETSTPNITSFPYGLSFDDWNFDGFMDISLWIAEGGTSLNSPSYFWLWNNEKQKYVRNKDLEEISSETFMGIDTKKQQIYAKYRRNDGYYEGYYIWQEGEVVLVRTVDTTWVNVKDDASAHARYIIKELVDGELVIVDDYIED